MKAQWWIRDGKRINGPVSVEELKAMAGNSQISHDSQLRLGRSTKWVKAQSLPWLRECYQQFDEKSKPPPSEVSKLPNTAIKLYAFIASAICVVALIVSMVIFFKNNNAVSMARRESGSANISRSEDVQDQPKQNRGNSPATSARVDADAPFIDNPDHSVTIDQLPATAYGKPSDSTPIQRGRNQQPRRKQRGMNSKAIISSPQAAGNSTPIRLNPGSIIKDIRDEHSIEQAVGLVVCGWKGVTNKLEKFEHRIQPLFYAPGEIAALAPDVQAKLTEIELANGKKMYVELLLGGTGSCFMISPNGCLLTNKHVLDEVRRIGADSRIVRQVKRQLEYRDLQPKVWVFLDKKAFEAKILHASSRFDVAILKINIDNAPYFQLETSNQLARAAEVWALGFPGASREPVSAKEEKLEQTMWTDARRIESFFKPSDLAYVMTDGTVNVVQNREGFGRIIQHNADLSGGNSGGPLVNDSGVVVGINTISITQASGGKASGIFYSLKMKQLRSEIEQCSPDCVWK